MNSFGNFTLSLFTVDIRTVNDLPYQVLFFAFSERFFNIFTKTNVTARKTLMHFS